MLVACINLSREEVKSMCTAALEQLSKIDEEISRKPKPKRNWFWHLICGMSNIEYDTHMENERRAAFELLEAAKICETNATFTVSTELYLGIKGLSRGFEEEKKV